MQAVPRFRRSSIGVLEPRFALDVCGHILRTWMPPIHAGMTEAGDGQNPLSRNSVRRDARFFMLCKAHDTIVVKRIVSLVGGKAKRR